MLPIGLMETEEASIGKVNILVTKAGVKSPRPNLKEMHTVGLKHIARLKR